MSLKKYSAFEELPLSSIEPAGWLKEYLNAQKDGLTGHLDEIGYPFDSSCWSFQKLLDGGFDGWWPYEQISYWLDGLVRCGHLLRDKSLLKKAVKQFEECLQNAGEDGFIGPEELKKPNKNNQWPHAVFFRALIAHYSATGDPGIIEAVKNHYLSGYSDYSHGREIVNVENILWLYEKTGDEKLLSIAVKAFDLYNKNLDESGRYDDTSLINLLSDRKISAHGVTFNEVAKIGAILYKYTGKEEFLNASVNAYKKIDRDAMLADGVHSAAEAVHGKNCEDGHETCDIADFTWSLGYLLMITGNTDYADKIEKACFNAAQGAIGPAFKSFQYISCPNQVIAAPNSNHSGSFPRTPRMAYQPHHYPECCAGNVNRIMPNYASRMWLRGEDGSLVSALYGPSTVTERIGDSDDTEVTIVEETDYPFSDIIHFKIICNKPVKFSLKLRIPGWCKTAEIHLNGLLLETTCNPGTFTVINRLFNPGDSITLKLPMDLTLRHWPQGGISIERGPIVYSLKIQEDWQVDIYEPRQTKAFPAYTVTPSSPWNYALDIDGECLAENIKIVEEAASGIPWWSKEAPVRLLVPARKVKDWKTVKNPPFEETDDEIVNMKTMQKCGCTMILEPLEFTPKLPDSHTIRNRLEDKEETVTLVPYGCTRLRLTVFPKVL